MPFHVSNDSYGKIFTTKRSLYALSAINWKSGEMGKKRHRQRETEKKKKVYEDEDEAKHRNALCIPIDIEICAIDYSKSQWSAGFMKRSINAEAENQAEPKVISGD